MKLAVVLTTALLAQLQLVHAAGDCTGTPNTLTWSCGGVCDDYVPCLVYNASDCEATSEEHKASCTNDDDDVCAYTCFSGIYPESNTLSFLIPFSSRETESSAETGFENDTDSLAWATNDALKSIGVASLDPNVNYVYFYGGSSSVYADFVFGKGVEVQFEDGFVADNNNLSAVYLYSLDMSGVTNLPALLPTNILGIGMRNALVSEFPYNAPDFQAVQVMDLSYNYISDFNGSFASLAALYLNNNSFTTIPDAIFNISSLKYLHMAGNPLAGMPTFTRAQVTFLQGLSDFDLHVYDFAETPNCGSMATVVVHNIIVCVSDELSGSASSSSGASESSASTSGSSDNEHSGTAVRLIAGVVIGVVLVVAIIFGLRWWRKRRNRRKESTTQQQTLTGEVTPSSNTGAHLWNDEQLQALRVDARDITDVKKIGSGSFGVVWLVRYRSSQLLASKRPLGKGAGGSGGGIRVGHRAGSETQQKQQQVLQRFVEEVKLVAQLDHMNIVAFMGVAWTFHSDIQALFEYMENGDLRDYLANNEPVSETTKTVERLSAEAFKLQIASDIVDALVYVHSFAPPVVHRDLKSRNVLLSSPDWHAKITDFGSARVQSENATMTVGVGTGRWLAPEVLSGSKDYGPAADMFAFGVMLSELETHQIPYDDARGPDGKKPLANVAILQLVAEGKLRPTFFGTCRPAIKELGHRCMAQEPEHRPTAPQVAYELRQILKVVQVEQEQSVPGFDGGIYRGSSYRLV